MNANIKTDRWAPLAVSTAIFACVLGAPKAFADDGVRIERVNFQDLNVDSSAGVEALYARIHFAAARVCHESDRMLQDRGHACARKAEVEAIEKLNLPHLTAYYLSKRGGHVQPLSASR